MIKKVTLLAGNALPEGFQVRLVLKSVNGVRLVVSARAVGASSAKIARSVNSTLIQAELFAVIVSPASTLIR